MSEPLEGLSDEFSFWEFVCCSKCQLPFRLGPGATIPFWLTECGHVVCNNHLNPDQSCAQCKSLGIQLIPLQHDMEAPMSAWFESVPYILDSAAYAVKFQQESMASQIRNLRARHQQQKGYIEKLKLENAQLKQTNEMLSIQLNGLHDHTPRGHEPATFLNVNGKRQMIDASHPRTVSTPLKPDRITLPPGHQPPQLAANQVNSSDENVPPLNIRGAQRPGSSRFVQQFAYSPAQKAQMRPPQAAPNQVRRPLRQDSRMQMPPPPPPKTNPCPSSNNDIQPSQVLYHSVGPSKSPRDAPGPSLNISTSSRALTDHQPNANTTTNRSLPLNEQHPPPTGNFSNSANRRFIPPFAKNLSGTFRPATSSHPSSIPRTPSFRPQPLRFSGGGSGQRQPFVPQGQ